MYDEHVKKLLKLRKYWDFRVWTRNTRRNISKYR